MNSAEYVKAVDDFATAGHAIGGLMEDCIADLATCEDKLKAAERERDSELRRLTEMAREVRETLRPFAREEAVRRWRCSECGKLMDPAYEQAWKNRTANHWDGKKWCGPVVERSGEDPRRREA